MGALTRQLRLRLILGSLVFLLGLTGAIILVVRDSLVFSARNMTEAGTLALLEQRESSLLVITRREAELSDHAIHHEPAILDPLYQRLQHLATTPNGFAFVMNVEGTLVAASSENIELLVGEFEHVNGSIIPPIAMSSIDNAGLQTILPQMLSGLHGTSRIELGTESALIAYAPLEETGWSLAIVEPVADIALSAQPLSDKVQGETGNILQATLVTIGYFAVVVIIGAILAARALTGPIQSLVDGTRAITAGNLSVRIPVKSSDELGVLAESFNQMADELSRQKEEAGKINASLLKSEERFRLAIEAAPNAMVMGNENGRIVLVNRQAELLFGYSHAEMIGQPLELMLPNQFHELHENMREDFLRQPVRRQIKAMPSIFGRRKDGSEFPAEVAYNPIETEEGMFILGSIVDISERQQLAEARIQAAVEERQRLARELHDSVTQSLYSLTLLAEASRRTAQSGELQKVVDNIARLGETAQQALKEMRLLVYELRPLALENTGLSDALQNRLDAVEKRAGVDSQLRVDLEVELPAEVENALYRIAQEILNNSLKHAEASRVQVTLCTREGKAEVEIQDNGKGFDYETAKNQGGMGLENIQERTEALGGQVSISTQSGSGTRIRVTLPLPVSK